MMKTDEAILRINSRTERLLRVMEELYTAEHSQFWEERIEVLRSVHSFLDDAFQLYRETDRRIEEVVNHERIIWPKTEFGVNRFDQLAEFDYLIHPESHRK